MDDSSKQDAPFLEALQTPPEPDATALPDHVRLGTEESNFGSTGPYRLLKKLGEGGMGTVWLAEQVAPVKRQVAVKVIAGRFGDRDRQRFDFERQSLAIMNHPAIAK